MAAFSFRQTMSFTFFSFLVVVLPAIASGASAVVPASESDIAPPEITTSSKVESSDDFEVEDYEFHDDYNDLVVLTRLKRDFYDRDPWGRMPKDRRPYYRRRGGRRISPYNTRRHSRGRRLQHQSYRGPDYGNDFEETRHRLTNAGYVDTSAFDSGQSEIPQKGSFSSPEPPKEPPTFGDHSKPQNNFVSARASGVARTESSGSSS